MIGNLFAPVIAAVVMIAAVVVDLTIRAASAASSTFAELTTRVTAASGVAMLAKGARELALCFLANTLELGVLEQSVGLLLGKKRLKILRETFYGLGGELFTALHVLSTI